MKLIPLTRGEFAMVDDEDFEYLSKFKWHCVYLGKSKYARRRIPATKDRIILMHREIIGLRPGDERFTDHVDGNGLNNQKINLRICTRQQNNFNSRLRPDNLSGYKGIYFGRKHSWEVRVTQDKKRNYVGSFKNLPDAINAYNNYILKRRGQFARLTPIPSNLIQNKEVSIC